MRKDEISKRLSPDRPLNSGRRPRIRHALGTEQRPGAARPRRNEVYVGSWPTRHSERLRTHSRPLPCPTPKSNAPKDYAR